MGIVPGDENRVTRGKVPKVKPNVQNPALEVLRRKIGARDTGRKA